MIRKGHLRAWGCGLVLLAAAACRPTAAPATYSPATEVPQPTVASTSGPTWILVDAAAGPPIRSAVEMWAGRVGLEVRAEGLAELEEPAPAGLWGIVGEEEGLLLLRPAGSSESIVLVVVNPATLPSGPRTSTLGPEVAYDEAGFLMGVAAGLATQTGHVGIAAESGEGGEWRGGFEEGLLYACPKCQVDSVPGPNEAGFGTDVVAIPPGGTAADVEPKVQAPWLVLFGDPPPSGWEGRVAASVRTAPEAIVASALGRLWDGHPGEAWTLSAADGGLVTEVDSAAISPGRERILREAEVNLAAGLLVVGGGV